MKCLLIHQDGRQCLALGHPAIRKTDIFYFGEKLIIDGLADRARASEIPFFRQSAT